MMLSFNKKFIMLWTIILFVMLKVKLLKKMSLNPKLNKYKTVTQMPNNIEKTINKL